MLGLLESAANAFAVLILKCRGGLFGFGHIKYVQGNVQRGWVVYYVPRVIKIYKQPSSRKNNTGGGGILLCGTLDTGTPSTVPIRTVYDGAYHTPLGRFSMLDISTVGIVPVPETSALETFRRVLSEHVSFGIGTLLVVEQSSLETRPRGCDMHRRRRVAQQR